jgi:hypothetical protein
MFNLSDDKNELREEKSRIYYHRCGEMQEEEDGVAHYVF